MAWIFTSNNNWIECVHNVFENWNLRGRNNISNSADVKQLKLDEGYDDTIKLQMERSRINTLNRKAKIAKFYYC